jgi:hypothetical protein
MIDLDGFNTNSEIRIGGPQYRARRHILIHKFEMQPYENLAHWRAR